MLMLTTGAAVICVALRDAGCDRLPLGLFPGDRVEADLRCGSSGGEAGWLEECGSIAACGKNRRQTGAGTWANRSGNQRKQLTAGCEVNGGPKNTFRCKLGGAGTGLEGKKIMKEEE